MQEPNFAPHTDYGDESGCCQCWTSRPHPHLTGVHPVVGEVDGVEGEGAVPEVVEAVGDPRLLNRCAILEPHEAEQVKGPGVGDALELGDTLLPGDGDVGGRDDDIGGHVHLQAGVHLQHDVVRVLLLAQLGVSGTRSETEKLVLKINLVWPKIFKTHEALNNYAL